VRAAVGVLGEILVTAGVLVVLFLVWQLWWTDVVAGRAQAEAVTRLERSYDDGSAPVAGQNGDEGVALGILRIPRLGIDWARPIREGTDAGTLEDGVGHYVDTAGPGEVGNFAVAGHRVTYARPFHDIDSLRPGDPVVVETPAGWDVYTVRRHEVVAPTQTDVIAPVPEEPAATPSAPWMTLTACHPRYSAAQRYVVFARLTDARPRSKGPPAALSGGAG
jgi:sortase A